MCEMGGGKMAVQLLWGRRGRGLLVRPWLGTRGSIVVRPWLLDVFQLIGLQLSGLPSGIRYACQNVESRSGGELGPVLGTCSDITSKDLAVIDNTSLRQQTIQNNGPRLDA
jgi:hypothetical protein